MTNPILYIIGDVPIFLDSEEDFHLDPPEGPPPWWLWLVLILWCLVIIGSLIWSFLK